MSAVIDDLGSATPVAVPIGRVAQIVGMSESAGIACKIFT